MKCDRCGRQFSARDATADTYKEAVSTPSRKAYTELRAITLCPDCAASREGVRKFYFWAFGTLLVVIIATAFLRGCS